MPNEYVYISQKIDFLITSKPNRVCKLNKAMNGFKLAPRTWFHKLFATLVGLGF